MLHDKKNESQVNLMSLPDDEILINHVTDILHIQGHVQWLISKDKLSFFTFVVRIKRRKTCLKTCFVMDVAKLI